MMRRHMAIDFASRGVAHAWLADEPFTPAGLYASVEVHAFVNLWPQCTGFPPASSTQCRAIGDHDQTHRDVAGAR